MHRRSFVMIGAAATVAAAQEGAPTREPGPPIVLVHGGWHGAWCWRRVAALLRAAGREVHTPTLTGLGERAHLASPAVDLQTHIQDVLGLIEAEELSDIVLVGHSYAGMVITGVADRAAGRVRSLVYLDAFVPEPGHAALDYIAPERRGALRKAGEASGYLEPLPAGLFGITDPADLRWVARRMTRQSFATFTQALVFERDRVERLRRSVVYCANPPSGSFDAFARKLRDDPAWRFHELQTGHDCMVTQPDAVARIVLASV